MYMSYAPACDASVREIVDVMTDHAARQAAQSQRDIASRCVKIQQDGDDASFVETLDYYTTIRVKSAYLCMNAEGIN